MTRGAGIGKTVGSGTAAWGCRMRPSIFSAFAASLARARRRLSGAVFGNRSEPRWPSMADLLLFAKELDRARDPSAAAEALVAAVAHGTGAATVLLLSAEEPRGVLVAVAAHGADAVEGAEVPADNPLLSWLADQDRMVSASGASLLPQWQTFPAGLRTKLASLGETFLLSVPCGPSCAALLVVGDPVRGLTRAPEEASGVETLSRLAATAMHAAHARKRMQEMEMTLQSALGELVSSAHMARLGEAVAAAAAGLADSLSSIAEMAEEVRRLAGADDPLRRAGEAVEEEVSRAQYRLRSILDLASSQASARPVMDVNAVLSSVASDVGLETTNAGVTCAPDLDPASPLIWGDPHDLRPVFVNLVSNSLDAMPHGGALSISTRATQGYVEIRFADTGLGIRREHMERVFDPHFTTKAQGKGNGLGLAACRRTVEQHGGSIALHSQWGQGTRVTILLPLAELAQGPLGPSPG